MSLTRLFVATLLGASALAIAACSSATPAASSGGPAATGAGTCDSACAYYLGCKQIDSEATRKDCNANCGVQGYTADQLSGVQKMDCPTAVCTIEQTCGTSSGTSGTSGSTGSSGSSGKDCFGCQHDGTSCIYIAPGGGAYSQCDPSCC
jgi:hypothetical protein